MIQIWIRFSIKFSNYDGSAICLTALVPLGDLMVYLLDFCFSDVIPCVLLTS